MTTPSPAHPSSGFTSAHLSNLILITLLLLSSVYGTALIVYGEKKNSFRVLSSVSKHISFRGSERMPLTKDLSIFFRHNCSDLSQSAQSQLIEFAMQLTYQKSLRLQVEGHCDRRGTKSYNRSLGRERAHVVKEFLIARGVSGDRIETVSFGEERPLAEGSSENIWSKNRRATIRILGSKQSRARRLVVH